MRPLHEPLQRHIHDEVCSEVNDMIIRLKVHNFVEIGTEEEIKRIQDAKTRHKKPSSEELIELLAKAYYEMNDCKQPFKKY